MNSAGSYQGPNIFQWLAETGWMGLIYGVVTIFLVGWLWILALRIRPLSDYLAFLFATLYPLCLAFVGAGMGLSQYFYDLGNRGVADPGYLSRMASHIGEFLAQFICGAVLTSVFLPLGVAVLLLRKPK